MRRLLRLTILVGLGIWAWRTLLGGRRPQERAGATYSDGSSVVFEPGSDGFERLAAVARPALRR